MPPMAKATSKTWNEKPLAPFALGLLNNQKQIEDVSVLDFEDLIIKAGCPTICEESEALSETVVHKEDGTCFITQKEVLSRRRKNSLEEGCQRAVINSEAKILALRSARATYMHAKFSA